MKDDLKDNLLLAHLGAEWDPLASQMEQEMEPDK